ncbi:uncharacterized protein B0J16DRAFT_349288 [Fusarium flagelliforme]|uniref:uncharacterized protein n=1 Tax=Fusarium flagelliforme TaxID=2675880 RepID=UPI001E8E0678|nr:uncharacterized protein B0J16DRAFT_349288 [Fusarium flagelliforme]KAH7174859.1 hypothetical protein B0J16DRAFT_349288 [Fusarium flagelliforme]
MVEFNLEASDIAETIYAAGHIIQLRINFNDDQNTNLQVKIRRQTRPWTLSCGMVVSIEGRSETGDDVFLKMFDRRGAQQIRQDNGIDAWNETIEHDFVRDLKLGKIEGFLEKLRTVPDFQDETEEDWDAAENEAFLTAELRKCFDAEVATYARLQENQGKVIPRLLDAVTLNADLPNVKLSPQQQELYRPKGVLLQYLQGFQLTTLADNAPKEFWQNIVDQAIRIVHILNDHEILNADVRPDNFIIIPKGDKYAVFMIDFGQCRFRREDESDEQWGRAKWIQDEEGAVGYVMRMMLRKVGFELRYEPSDRYLPWAPGEDDEM